MNEETEILNFLNEVTGSKFREIKSNLTKITALLKQGFTKEQIIDVVKLKVIEWKNNPAMAGYLRPETLFRVGKFEGYLNQLERIKKNPQMYAKHFAEINNIKTADNTSGAFDKIDAMFGKRG